MATIDQLILGGIVFENVEYAPPTKMPFGGQQAMIVHKLPGGSRVIDLLGPDEDDITWAGFFFTPAALARCQTLDAMRASGAVLTLSFGGMSRSVVIKRFKGSIRRYPNWCEYEISCTVTANPSYGVSAVTGATIGLVTSDSLIQNDLATALKASTEQ